MSRTWLLVAVLCAGCEEKVDKAGERAADKAKEMVPDKVKSAANAVDKGLDKMDSDEAKQHVENAKASIARGEEPREACAWAANAPDSAERTTLQQLCAFDVPMIRARRAVVAAEKARAEQQDAPSLTECSSDEWAGVKTKLDADFSGKAEWTDLKARWAKACPGA